MVFNNQSKSTRSKAILKVEKYLSMTRQERRAYSKNKLSRGYDSNIVNHILDDSFMDSYLVGFKR